MEVIVPGVIKPPPPPAWPIGRRFMCPDCGCQFRLEEGDDFKQMTERCINGNSFVTVTCPTCDKPLKFDRRSWMAENP